jgi:DNA topoisomerase IB
VPRLRRTSPAQRGWTRRRAGRGFVYLDERGARLPPEEVARIKALAIPPAWRDVWICPWPNGHLQAVGTDDAGRRQYLYHEAWCARRDRQKHDRVIALAARLPAARAVVTADLDRAGMPLERALAAGFRLLDLGALRIGGERYARQHGTYGLVTLRREHVRLEPGRVRIAFLGKANREQEIEVADRALRAAVEVLLARPLDAGDRLLAWRDDTAWHEVTSKDINDYVRAVTGLDVTAKDLRTLRATVIAAASLARAGQGAGSAGQRRRVVAEAVRAVAEHLGNTPVVARTSYIDPRVVDAYLGGAAVVVPAADEGSVESFQLGEAALVEWLAG